ncbi:protein adenylyltransferase SelO [Oceanicoccus sagamiensis]|uniref:Protein nucleotidyltransferase YdiU n=1 Tax=Oceanicoccus sagamiensis TaxID=716816 RepID=A0A1X9NPC7_9GAMM|nr:YdiU family protein [Oceanicoccus sagamiensis]ARN75743.1 hypothetical protein BST96_17500 [Oceanicoccus sagamiensis]
MIKFTNSYAQLGESFFERILPTPVTAPSLLLWNDTLAEQLELSNSLRGDQQLQAAIFSGNQLPEGSDSMALAYSGHQFGQLNPQLGDGRAHLLGELLDKQGRRFDIQLKGSGRTPYSRQGDGRCALGPALREYIMSEAMYFLGVPTSRCLAVVATGDPVYRESVKPGAVVTRIAASHIRIGTFTWFAIRKDLESLSALLDYAIVRHFPELDNNAENKAIAFLDAVLERQITLMVAWLRVGFIHGVMNTDNTAISGETIDFGPCAMMGSYHPATVYSSIDTQGRYAFGNQPNIAVWNLTRLAECLIPLVNTEEKQAIASLEPVLLSFSERFDQAYFSMMGAKLGIAEITEQDRVLIETLLESMQSHELDYTQTFHQLTHSIKGNSPLPDSCNEWFAQWQARLEPGSQALMQANNPVVIPRNHHIESVLKACEESGSTAPAENILEVLRSPYSEIAATKDYQGAAEDKDASYQTFCGT